MKTYRLSFAASLDHIPAHPERTTFRQAGAYAAMNFDLEYKVWPSAGAVQTALAMQSRHEPRRSDWTAWKPRRTKAAAL